MRSKVNYYEKNVYENGSSLILESRIGKYYKQFKNLDIKFTSFLSH